MNKLLFVSLICFMFMIIEFAGGIYAQATAVLADAAHMLSDVAGFMISYCAISISDKKHTFRNGWGYHRVEVLGAIAGVFLIWGLLIGINVFATYKIITKSYFLAREDQFIFLGTACFGLACNLTNLLALNCFCNPEDEEEDPNHSSTVSSIKYSTN